MPMIETRDGVCLYVKCWGDGPPVVMIHGWPLDSDSFDSQMLGLAEAGFRAIAYDRRGFGRSEQPWSGYDYDSFADDLADVLASCGATDGVTLAGFSMGGGEVARYMSRHGGAGVVKAALLGAVVPGVAQSAANPHGAPKAVLDEMAAGVEADRAAFLGAFFKTFYGLGTGTTTAVKDMLGLPPKADTVSAEMLEQSHRWAMLAGLWPTLAAMKAFGSTDFTADMAAFSEVETLIIHGTADKVVPIDATARRAHAMIPGSKLLEYDGAPHGFGATHSTRLTADLVAFAGS